MAWSSRRNVVSLLLGLGGLGAIGGWAWTRGRAAGPGAAPPGPKLLVRPGEGCPEPSQGEQKQRTGDAAWLALATLPPDKRNELVDEIDALAASLEARAHPLGLDLLEADPGQVLGSLSPWFLPVANAAQSLLAGHWRAGDDALCVDVIAAEQVRARTGEGKIVDPWDESTDDADGRQARFLAWPVARARLVGLSTRAEAERVARALRSRVVSEESTLALVIDAELQRRPDGFSGAKRVREVCRRCGRLLQRAGDAEDASLRVAWGLFRGASEPPSENPLVGWLPLGESELFVVPRLSALARLDAFRSEISRVVG